MKPIVIGALLIVILGAFAGPVTAQTNPALLRPANLTEQSPVTYKAEFQLGNGSKFVIEVHRDWDPSGADRFYNLVKNGFYDGVRFFRVLPNFMAQFGMNGNPAVTSAWRNAKIKDEPVKEGNKRGNVSFAKPGLPNSRTTQVFINTADNASALDGMGFSAFGQVITGMDVVDKLYSGYGEGAPSGRGPNQQLIQNEGNAYLAKDFPRLDFIQKAIIVK